MAVVLRKTHVVPTHVHAPEIAFSLGLVSVSVRQFLLLLIGAAMSYDLWLHVTALAGLPGGQLMRLLIALLPVGLALALAFLRVAGRALEHWLVAFLRFWLRPRRFVWRSVRFQEWCDGTALSDCKKGGSCA